MKKRILVLYGGFLLTSGVMLHGCAMHQDVLLLDERVASLEKRNKASGDEIDKLDTRMESLGEIRSEKEQELRQRYASMRLELQSLLENVQLLNGRIEELEYQQKESKATADDKIRGLDVTVTANTGRLEKIEKHLGLENAGGNSAGGSGKTAEPAPLLTAKGKKLPEQDAYKLAKETFDKGNLDSARERFGFFVRDYPESKNADNAQFWIGETYYRQNQYKKAIVEYQYVIEKYPKGNKVPAALLKQGLAFKHLDQKSNARLVLNELIKKYPESGEAAIAAKAVQSF